MKRVKLIQGTPEWHKWRLGGIGGSDAPAVMGESPYKTPRQLWMNKTGQVNEEIDESKEFIFAKGHATEAKIRQEYASLRGIEMTPQCVIHSKFEFLRASLDGFHLKRGVLEGKLVGKKTIEEALKGNIPQHHFIQIQHNLMVTGADLADYFCHDGKNNGVLLEIQEDKEFQKRLMESEHEFWGMVTERKLPPITNKDYLVLEDPKEVALVRELAEAKELVENAEIEFDRIKKMILSKINHPKIYCEGVSIVKSERKGSIDYSKVPEISNLSEEYLEQYRRDSSTAWSILFDKVKKTPKKEVV